MHYPDTLQEVSKTRKTSILPPLSKALQRICISDVSPISIQDCPAMLRIDTGLAVMRSGSMVKSSSCIGSMPFGLTRDLVLTVSISYKAIRDLSSNGRNTGPYIELWFRLYYGSLHKFPPTNSCLHAEARHIKTSI